jgi:hypothetical protein
MNLQPIAILANLAKRKATKPLFECIEIAPSHASACPFGAVHVRYNAPTVATDRPMILAALHFAKACKSGVATVTANQEGIQVGGTMMKAIVGEVFPPLPEYSNPESAGILPSSIIPHLIDHADREKSSAVLSGIGHDGKGRWAATDGLHLLEVQSESLEGKLGHAPYVMPAIMAETLHDIDDDCTWTLHQTDKHIVATSGTWLVVCRKAEGTYPNYRGALDREPTGTVDLAPYLPLVAQAPCSAERQAVCLLSNGASVLAGEEWRLRLSTPTDLPAPTGVNRQYLKSAVKATGSTVAHFNRGLVFVGNCNQYRSRALVMPVTLPGDFANILPDSVPLYQAPTKSGGAIKPTASASLKSLQSAMERLLAHLPVTSETHSLANGIRLAHQALAASRK